MDHKNKQMRAEGLKNSNIYQHVFIFSVIPMKAREAEIGN